MSTRPRPSRTTAEDAARRIHSRRTRNHGRDECRLPDPRDLLGIVRHVRRFQDPVRHRLPEGLLRDDLADVTIILDYLVHALDVERLGSLQLGQRMMDLPALAALLGYEDPRRRGRQAVTQWIKRLRAAVELAGPKDADLVAEEAATVRAELDRSADQLEGALDAWHALVDLGVRGLLPADLVDDMRTLAHLETLPAALGQLREILGALVDREHPAEVRTFAAIASERLAA